MQKLDIFAQVEANEDLDTSNEEPKSSNDEMMPMNEELPSANEELSSTNEELQVRIIEGERMASERRLDEIEQLQFVNSQAIALLSADGTYLRTNLRMAEIDVLGNDDHVGRRMVTVVPDPMDEVQVTFNEFLRPEHRFCPVKLRAKRPHRTTNAAFFRRIGNPVKNETTIFLVGVNFRDITEQTEISAELRRVMKELQHREKNMLANVLALVSRARRDAAADIAVLDTLATRISALTHTHKVLTREN